MPAPTREQKVRFSCKNNLIALFNVFKESGDTQGCIDDFLTMINDVFNFSLVSTGITISKFLTDMDLDSWSYQDESELYHMLLEL